MISSLPGLNPGAAEATAGTLKMWVSTEEGQENDRLRTWSLVQVGHCCHLGHCVWGGPLCPVQPGQGNVDIPVYDISVHAVGA